MTLEKDSSLFHILTVGMGFDIIYRLWDRILSVSNFRFSHIIDPSIDKIVLSKHHVISSCYCVRDDIRMKMPLPDRGSLAALEHPEVPTIHNMIMSDRVVKKLNYTDALSYATYLENRFTYLFRQIDPSIIIGGYDGLHSGIALAVARKLNIPWFALDFTTIPKGLTGFRMGMTSDTSFSVQTISAEKLRNLAERTLHEFETQQLIIPAYISANNISMIIKRMPRHVRDSYQAVVCEIKHRFDKFTRYSARHLASEYFRKRMNMLFLPTKWFCDKPPAAPYIFIGLHMQPESSIDVWAPFFSDQFNVIEAISRSTPPTHQLLVKLHKSDADNYSRRQLDRLRRLPGVKLVSPFAQSRTFIEKASVVMAIQGNIALEAAILGRPVLVFGDTKFMDLPSVTRVNRVTDLPEQIRNKLSEEPPEREAIICGLMSYLSRYAPGCYNNWDVMPSTSEINDIAKLFIALQDYVNKAKACAE